jgi:hypothetical protein
MRRYFAVALATCACGIDEPLSGGEELAADVPICEALPELCAAVPSSGPAHSEPVQVVPGPGLPPEVVLQTSHNNLDLLWWRGRLYFAFRAAPFHYASHQTVLYVVSSADLESWRFEATFDLDTDLREPRFLAVGERLFISFAVLGTNILAFEPQGARVSERRGPGRWTAPEAIFEPGFIPWRARNIDGRGHLIGYVGGENIYENDREGLAVHWLVTDDGRSFAPAVGGQPVVLRGGSSETDFALLDDGSLVAVSRNEAGDELGWGSKICRAEAGRLGEWRCVADPKKYDSPLVLRDGGATWLIARRNVTETGDYDLFRRDEPPASQTTAYQLDYWQRPKRCSLWRVDPEGLAVSFVLDLPSRGDTCFASAVPLGSDAGAWLVFDYSSPLGPEGEDPSWLAGQQGPTNIHRLALRLR